jgi:hypothetical protein
MKVNEEEKGASSKHKRRRPNEPSDDGLLTRPVLGDTGC